MKSITRYYPYSKAFPAAQIVCESGALKGKKRQSTGCILVDPESSSNIMLSTQHRLSRPAAANSDQMHAEYANIQDCSYQCITLIEACGMPIILGSIIGSRQHLGLQACCFACISWAAYCTDGYDIGSRWSPNFPDMLIRKLAAMYLSAGLLRCKLPETETETGTIFGCTCCSKKRPCPQSTEHQSCP